MVIDRIYGFQYFAMARKYESFINFPGLLLPDLLIAPFTFPGLLDCDVNLNNVVDYPFYGS